MTETPVLDIDPFDAEVLRFPDPVHQQLREAAPVVYLERYGIWSMARFAEVRPRSVITRRSARGPAPG